MLEEWLLAGAPTMILADLMPNKEFRHHQLDQILNYHFSTGGKQLRAQLVLAQAKQSGLALEKAEVWARVCELLHNATLIHDDIQDNDQMRRGQESVWKKYGLAQAINAGDLLIFKAFTLASSLGSSELVSKLADISERLVQGQSMELTPLSTKTEDTWTYYLQMAELKTGALFFLPSVGVQILTESSVNKKWEKAWLSLGLCYQVLDDLKDYYGLKQKGQKYKDLTEKRLNALTSTLFNKGNEDRLRNFYFNGEASPVDQQEVLDQIVSSIESHKIPLRLVQWIRKEMINVQNLKDLSAAQVLFEHMESQLNSMESLNEKK